MQDAANLNLLSVVDAIKQKMTRAVNSTVHLIDSIATVPDVISTSQSRNLITGLAAVARGFSATSIMA
ncbi:hypothetical protein E3A20_22110 [Planctomyces bekefii]|uniref:Uncharacterized protein n=1 Tax=Planctomyces bekefii TaxID=1653850 RepID=A0A5C6M6K0_9PLAN|nr:hypothetical protein E3A20_22110 [Planctomyces bekefii]